MTPCPPQKFDLVSEMAGGRNCGMITTCVWRIPISAHRSANRPLLAAWIPSATMSHARANLFTYSSLCDDRQTPAAGWC